MKNFTKTGLLSLLLVIPVLFFFFLKFFGKNEFKLQTYFAYDSTMVNGEYKITSAHTIPDFHLTTNEGKPISGKDLLGNIYVANFIFTRCESICPKMSTQLTTVQEVFAKDSEVKIISFTVDPENDSVEVLKKYSTEYNAIADKWIFATGRKDSIYALAQRGFFITAMEDRERPLEFIHSDKFVLVDKLGRIRGYYNGTDKKDVDRLITEIKVLQKIYANQ